MGHRIRRELAVDELLKQLGFEGAAEFNRLIADVDLSTAAKITAFKRWQDEDGSKAGLEALRASHNTRDSPDQR
jgi:hypothetical protein